MPFGVAGPLYSFSFPQRELTEATPQDHEHQQADKNSPSTAVGSTIISTSAPTRIMRASLAPRPDREGLTLLAHNASPIAVIAACHRTNTGRGGTAPRSPLHTPSTSVV